MLKRFLNRFKDDRKYFAIVFFILILFLISAILTPVIVQDKKNNWKNELTGKINNIEESVVSLYKEKENSLLSVKSAFKDSLKKTLPSGNTSYGSLIQLVNNKVYDQLSVEVFAPNGRLIAWNKTIAIKQEELFPLEAPPGETFFTRTRLTTYLAVLDTVHLEGDQFIFTVSSPFEKHYAIQNQYYRELSFTKEISDRFYTQFEIDYNSFSPRSRDGRKYSFELINNSNKKTGLVTFIKPALDTSVKGLYEDIAKIQSFLAVSGFLFLALGYRSDYRKLKYRLYRFLVIVLYLSAFRMLMYYLSFPSNILTGDLVNPSYFSSAFGGGIVKSPVEFLITVSFLVIIAVTAYRSLRAFIYSEEIKKYRSTRNFLLMVIPAAFFFFMTLRGLSAAVRSVIFDSTLRYFKDPTLIPDFPSIIMNLNVLVLGTAVVLILGTYLLFLMSLHPAAGAEKNKKVFTGVFILFQMLGIGFLYIQHQPLISPVLSIFFISLVFVLVYHIMFIKARSIFNYEYTTLCASIITITLLNFFNLDLEREALKTTALELNRPNDNLLRFLVSETLTNAVRDESLARVFMRENHNYNATAFRVWSHSSLQRESVNSEVVIFNKSLQQVGSFGIGIDENINLAKYLSLPESLEPEVIEIEPEEGSGNRLFAAIVPVATTDRVVGFIAACVDIDVENLVAENFPPFLQSQKNILGSVLDISQLKIFEFRDGRLMNVKGDIYPSRDQYAPLVKTKFSPDNEAWTSLSLNNEKYLVYVLHSPGNDYDKITAVALREKLFSWNLYNFFKIFIIHSIFILSLFVILFSANFGKFRYSFRVQLLTAFLVISILPVVVLAVYNRMIVAERSKNEIYNELDERCRYLEKHLERQLEKNSGINLSAAFENAGQELGISFAVFEGSEQIYNSAQRYVDAGLFEKKINPEAYYNLNYLSYREYFASEKVENFRYDSFYKRVNIQDRNYVIEVNDALNKVSISFSVLDVDIFLFGVYSFAVIIIIISSTILANKISSPIRRLTKATDSVAHGDLNVFLQNDEKGEIRELFDGFNMMTRELKKNESDLAELERETAWKEMAKQVAHEIKNPLTPMKLAIQQLVASYRDKNRNFDDMFEKLSSTVLNQIENLSQIASEFSRFAKMPNLNLEKIDLVPVVKDTVNLFVDEKIKIEVNSESEAALVEADKPQLRRMFINFIRNSIQAGATKIQLSISREDNCYYIRIEDNGSGIPEEVKEKIFETNFTTKAKGMGIGLKLAKRFLEGISGNIELLKSTPAGTVFRISIPVFNQD